MDNQLGAFLKVKIKLAKFKRVATFKKVIANKEISKRENAASSRIEVKNYPHHKKRIRDLITVSSTLKTGFKI
jgi:hypothetical protein